MTRYLTYQEAADFIRVPIGSLRAMVHAKKIPHVRIGPRTVTFELADLEKWLANQVIQAKPVEPREYDGGVSPEHEEAIRRLAPSADRTGLPQKLLLRTGVAMSLVEEVIPDAFVIDEIASCVDLFEVEHTHPLTDLKLDRLRALRDRLSTVGWSMRLFAASTQSESWTEIDIETGDLAMSELTALIAANHVRFEMP